ncbi:CIC11C00000001121 [Sungouiella intermedia]|uniref:CIC11C00000000827 n=1 Tax=Sungouiella intermedia TaxID=45354 RepID=A0A1L0BDD9_9ASCO|nr:CIC11C00000001121 [[Candida] intermedia]SGZ49639.1 CIC11C00000000827 [[Candida] intermedia]
MDTDHELTVIASEYESYFPDCVLMLQTTTPHKTQSSTDAPQNSRSAPSHIRITTQEGRQLKVTVAVAGWYVCGKDVYYHNFEALMNNESPAFARTFANTLTGKLQALAKQLPEHE